MSKLNWTRVILGGLAAGLVINIGSGLLNGLILQDRWSKLMTDYKLPAQMTPLQIAGFNVAGFAMGILLIWTYASIRPRYGPGPSTAICAAVAVWFIGSVLPGVIQAVPHLIPRRMIAMGVAVSLVTAIIGGVVGAMIYKEEAAPQARATSA